MTDQFSDDRWDVVFVESLRSSSVFYSVRDRVTDRVRKGRSSHISWLASDVRRTKETLLREADERERGA